MKKIINLFLIIILFILLTSCNTKTNYYRVEEGEFHVHYSGWYDSKTKNVYKIEYYSTTIKFYTYDEQHNIIIETTPERVEIIHSDFCPICNKYIR